MSLSVDANDEVHLPYSGIEGLRLKAALASRIESVLKVEKGELVFPASCLSMLVDLFPPAVVSDEIFQLSLHRFTLHAEARSLLLEIMEVESVERVSEEWLQRLDPPQSVAVSAMTVPNLLGLCLFDEQGSGKTVMTIAAFDILKAAGEVDAMIVVCPKSMLSEWPKDIERFVPGKYSILLAEGDRRDKYEKALMNFDVLLTNYEGIEPMQVTLSAASSRKAFLLVVDESFYVKNSESLRADSARRLRIDCKRCFVLCGTPAPNSAYDLVNQFDLADIGYTFGSFKRTKNEAEDVRAIAELIEAKGTLIRRLKSAILDEVPEKNFHIISIPLTGRQALMYEKARKNLELELRGLDNTSFRKRLVTYFQKRNALLQICSNPASIDPTMAEHSVKLDRLDELLENLVLQGRKVILWSFYRKSLDELATRYAKYSPVRIDGTVDIGSRREAVRLFQNDPSRMLFIGNPAAAGAGITLHAAYDAVYVSYSNQAAHYLQSLDRIHRRGQKSKEVNYFLLVCTGTIEETEVLRLRSKELQQHSLLGDHIPWPTSLDDALNELTQFSV
jgi:SNF2 family DNA or RNA helicase